MAPISFLFCSCSTNGVFKGALSHFGTLSAPFGSLLAPLCLTVGSFWFPSTPSWILFTAPPRVGGTGRKASKIRRPPQLGVLEYARIPYLISHILVSHISYLILSWGGGFKGGGGCVPPTPKHRVGCLLTYLLYFTYGICSICV